MPLLGPRAPLPTPRALLASTRAWFFDPTPRGQSTTPRTWWPIVVDLANRQHGVVVRWQLLALGVPAKTIDNWVEAKMLHAWHRGVYAVGHRVLGANGRRKAAELAGGEEAALCCHTAGDFLAIRQNASGTIHIWVPSQRGRKLDGIVPHRFTDMAPEDIEVIDGIRTTSPMRTLVDLAPILTLQQLRAAFDRTELHGQFDLHTLNAILDRRPRRPGSRNIRQLLASYEGPLPTLTELEERGLEMIGRAGVPVPVAQHYAAAGRVDFYWPERKLILEMDSFRWHSSRDRFEQDRARDAEHLAQGIATLRITWAQAGTPEAADRLRRAYANRLVL